MTSQVRLDLTSGTSSIRRHMRLQPVRNNSPLAVIKSCFLWIICASCIIFLIAVPTIFNRNPRSLAYVWPANMSRSFLDYVTPGKSSVVIEPLSPCSSEGSSTNDNINILVMVCSAPQNFHERQVIRETWASDALTADNVRVLFILGETLNNTVQERIQMEAGLNEDIVQEHFLDSYANLTLKSLMLLKWYTETCDNSTHYVLKTDDDVYINLNFLSSVLSVRKNHSAEMLMGTLICGATPIRDPYNKWYTPNYLFQGKFYPNYLSGTGYVLSYSAASKLIKASMTTPMLHLEDIYITGILAKEIGVRPEDHVGFSYLKKSVNVPCIYAQSISSHHLNESEMRKVAKHMLRKDLTCKAYRKKFLRPYGPGKCKW